MKVKIIDPPSGWMYGFPKVLPDYSVDLKEWLIQNGYPKKLIDQGCLEHCRFWVQEVEDIES